jgi:hypothetical protein
MPSSKNSLSEEQIFADIMEMISSSNKKSKNVKNNKKTKNVKNNKKNSKKNLRGGNDATSNEVTGMEPANMESLGVVESYMQPSLNDPSRNVGFTENRSGSFGPMGGSDDNMNPMVATMSGGKKKKRVVKKSGAKKPAKKSVAKKSVAKKVVKKSVAKKVVKKVGAKKVKKVGAKKVKKSGAKKVKKVVKKSKRVAKK